MRVMVERLEARTETEFEDSLGDEISESMEAEPTLNELELVLEKFANTPMAYNGASGVHIAHGSRQAIEMCDFLQNDKLPAAYLEAQFHAAASLYDTLQKEANDNTEVVRESTAPTDTEKAGDRDDVEKTVRDDSRPEKTEVRAIERAQTAAPIKPVQALDEKKRVDTLKTSKTTDSDSAVSSKKKLSTTKQSVPLPKKTDGSPPNGTVVIPIHDLIAPTIITTSENDTQTLDSTLEKIKVNHIIVTVDTEAERASSDVDTIGPSTENVQNESIDQIPIQIELNDDVIVAAEDVPLCEPKEDMPPIESDNITINDYVDEDDSPDNEILPFDLTDEVIDDIQVKADLYELLDDIDKEDEPTVELAAEEQIDREEIEYFESADLTVDDFTDVLVDLYRHINDADVGSASEAIELGFEENEPGSVVELEPNVQIHLESLFTCLEAQVNALSPEDMFRIESEDILPTHIFNSLLGILDELGVPDSTKFLEMHVAKYGCSGIFDAVCGAKTASATKTVFFSKVKNTKLAKFVINNSMDVYSDVNEREVLTSAIAA